MTPCEMYKGSFPNLCDFAQMTSPTPTEPLGICSAHGPPPRTYRQHREESRWRSRERGRSGVGLYEPIIAGRTQEIGGFRNTDGVTLVAVETLHFFIAL